MSTSTGKILISGTLATIGIYLFATIFPVLGIILSGIVPLPFLYVRVTNGRMPAILILAVSTLVLSIVLSRLAGAESILFFLQLAVSGMIMGEIWDRGYALDKCTLYSVALATAASAVLLTVGALMRSMAPLEMLTVDLSQNMERTLELYRAMGMPMEPDQDIPTIAKQMAARMLEIVPALTIMGCTILVWANFLICGKIVELRKSWGPRWKDLKLWQAPERLVWVLVASGFCVLAPLGVVETIAINVLMVVALVYFLQGISIVAFYFEKKTVPRFIRGMVYVLIGIQQLLTLLVTVLGLFDTWFDFRKLHRSAT